MKPGVEDELFLMKVYTRAIVPIVLASPKQIKLYF